MLRELAETAEDIAGINHALEHSSTIDLSDAKKALQKMPTLDTFQGSRKRRASLAPTGVAAGPTADVRPTSRVTPMGAHAIDVGALLAILV